MFLFFFSYYHLGACAVVSVTCFLTYWCPPVSHGLVPTTPTSVFLTPFFGVWEWITTLSPPNTSVQLYKGVLLIMYKNPFPHPFPLRQIDLSAPPFLLSTSSSSRWPIISSLSKIYWKCFPVKYPSKNTSFFVNIFWHPSSVEEL